MLQALSRIIGRTEMNLSECRGVSRRHRSDPQQRLDGVQRWDQLEAAFLTAAGLNLASALCLSPRLRHHAPPLHARGCLMQLQANIQRIKGCFPGSIKSEPDNF